MLYGKSGYTCSSIGRTAGAISVRAEGSTPSMCTGVLYRDVIHKSADKTSILVKSIDTAI
jgi:hypothetical protein